VFIGAKIGKKGEFGKEGEKEGSMVEIGA